MTPTGPDRRSLVFGVGAIAGVLALGRATHAAAGDPDQAIEALIAAMTVEEKVGQLTMDNALSPKMATTQFQAMNPFVPHMTTAQALSGYEGQLATIRAGGVGFLGGPYDLEDVRKAQTTAVRESRLKIPLLFAADVIHGFRTVFPVPLAEAASWEPELARRTARAAATEAAASGLDMTFAPMVDVARDQRWGRVVEGAGEDSYLSCRFAAARVTGFQGRLGAVDSLLACPKHFAAYGAAEAGLDYNGAPISERVLRETYLPPFAAAYRAGAIATMASFNTIDGVPSTANHHLLTDILRGELGFRGLVVSDYASEQQLIDHGVAADDADAARLAITAGCDVGMSSGIYAKNLPDLVRRGVVPMATLDEAVRRVLWVKKQAGLFDDPFRRIDQRRYAARDTDKAHRTLARDAARRSIVMLRNENGLLPLKSSGVRIALIGPFASDRANLNGPWSPLYSAGPAIPIDQGLKAAMADPALLSVVMGCKVGSPIAGGIEAAVAAARACDVVILALGESEPMSGESSSRAEIGLPAAQLALAEAVRAAGKPTVVVLHSGRALVLEGAVRGADAILAAWFLGSETGAALADIVFGAVSPSGRLPVSFPQADGQQPYHYDHENTGRPARPSNPLAKFTTHYQGVEHRALYPFGHGLTYSTVAYGPVSAPAAMGWNGTLEVSAELHNTGNWAIEEVAQLYIHDRVASLAPPVRRLKGFAKVRLVPGEVRNVSFTLSHDDLAFVNQALERVVEAGAFDVWIAPSAESGAPATFVLCPED